MNEREDKVDIEAAITEALRRKEETKRAFGEWLGKVVSKRFLVFLLVTGAGAKSLFGEAAFLQVAGLGAITAAGIAYMVLGRREEER